LTDQEMINRLDRLIRAQATTTDNYYQEIISRIVQLESDNKLIKTERDSLRRELEQNYTADAEIQKMIEDMHTENISLRRELAEARIVIDACKKLIPFGQTRCVIDAYLAAHPVDANKKGER
jgi:SMC interacting uncharacterized protein involved in chromosome segregation